MGNGAHCMVLWTSEGNDQADKPIDLGKASNLDCLPVFGLWLLMNRVCSPDRVKGATSAIFSNARA